jgi:hypothetical protein
MKGMVGLFTAVAARRSAAPPTADVFIRAKDYELDVRDTLSAGPHVIAFENSGPQVHDFEFVRLGDGQTTADIISWARNGAVDMPEHVVFVVGTAGMHPANGRVAWTSVVLPAGRYAVFCWVPDHVDERPHLLHGMIREVVVR